MAYFVHSLIYCFVLWQPKYWCIRYDAMTIETSACPRYGSRYRNNNSTRGLAQFEHRVIGVEVSEMVLINFFFLLIVFFALLIRQYVEMLTLFFSTTQVT